MARSDRPGPASTPKGDEILAQDFLAGEREAVARVERMISQILRFRGYYVPWAERRDLMQEVLLDVCEALNRKGFVLHLGFSAFVRSVSHRRCVDWMRRRRSHARTGPPIPDSSSSPELGVLQAERLEMVMKVLRDLREGCRTLIRLHVEDALTYHEIAERLGRREGALRVQMYECIKEVRDLLRRRYPGAWNERSGRRGTP